MQYRFLDQRGFGEFFLDLSQMRWEFKGAGVVNDAVSVKGGAVNRQRFIGDAAGFITQTWFIGDRLSFYGQTDSFRPGSSVFRDAVQGQLVPDAETGVLSQGAAAVWLATPRQVRVDGLIDYGLSGAEGGGQNSAGNR